jgi:hypothetical protein
MDPIATTGDLTVDLVLNGRQAWLAESHQNE